MNEKTHFSISAFYFFSHLQNFFFKGINTYPIDLSCHQKKSPTKNGNIGPRSQEYGKSHGQLDPPLRMREVARPRSIEFPRVGNH